MTDTEPDLLVDGPDKAAVTILLAHGAGAGMDTPFMTAFAQGLAARGARVVRFEFDYMAERRRTGKKRPPDRQPKLLARFAAMRDRFAGSGRLIVGGKSMGGRMASILAAEDGAGIAGVLCLGYPFHPPGKPDRLRIDHFPQVTVPVLIAQGQRDPFGTVDEVAGYGLPDTVEIVWLPDGDHNLKPRKASGRTEKQNWDAAIEAAAAKFID